MSKTKGVSQAKDDVEERLEHLLFGDDAAFHESLGFGLEGAEELDRRAHSDHESALPIDEDDLEEADDSRVRVKLPVRW